MMKHVVIGASPYDTLPVFLDDLLHSDVTPDTLVLVEGNAQLLELAVPLAQRLLDDAGKATRVEGSQDPVPALKDADLVLVAVAYGFAGRRIKDLTSLSTVLTEPAAQDAIADLLRLFRISAVLRKLWEALRKQKHEAIMLLSLPGAATLVRTVHTFGRIACLGVEAPVPTPLSEQRQYRALARLAKVRLEGLSREGQVAWEQSLSGRQNPLMRLSLALSGGEVLELPALCFPNGRAYATLPEDTVLVMPAQVDASGITPLPKQELTPEAEERLMIKYLFRTNVARAAALGDHTALREIVEEHPALYGTDRLLVFDLLLSLIDSQADFLPQFQ